MNLIKTTALGLILTLGLEISHAAPEEYSLSTVPSQRVSSREDAETVIRSIVHHKGVPAQKLKTIEEFLTQNGFQFTHPDKSIGLIGQKKVEELLAHLNIQPPAAPLTRSAGEEPRASAAAADDAVDTAAASVAAKMSDLRQATAEAERQAKEAAEAKDRARVATEQAQAAEAERLKAQQATATAEEKVAAAAETIEEAAADLKTAAAAAAAAHEEKAEGEEEGTVAAFLAELEKVMDPKLLKDIFADKAKEDFERIQALTSANSTLTQRLAAVEATLGTQTAHALTLQDTLRQLESQIVDSRQQAQKLQHDLEARVSAESQAAAESMRKFLAKEQADQAALEAAEARLAAEAAKTQEVNETLTTTQAALDEQRQQAAQLETELAQTRALLAGREAALTAAQQAAAAVQDKLLAQSERFAHQDEVMRDLIEALRKDSLTLENLKVKIAAFAGAAHQADEAQARAGAAADDAAAADEEAEVERARLARDAEIAAEKLAEEAKLAQEAQEKAAQAHQDAERLRQAAEEAARLEAAAARAKEEAEREVLARAEAEAQAARQREATEKAEAEARDQAHAQRLAVAQQALSAAHEAKIKADKVAKEAGKATKKATAAAATNAGEHVARLQAIVTKLQANQELSPEEGVLLEVAGLEQKYSQKGKNGAGAAVAEV